ncbi:hypothetical protein ElyMa_003294800 [Elysia marginata]|uniref:FLYWCH-type domain-containing protein n=1 Tax=Elysia marginata TaxID=1093978 RepID=A0AAV4JA41_9GAST|nr:hypothetical protein ElyMa_003294800 [Elysia marginata]
MRPLTPERSDHSAEIRVSRWQSCCTVGGRQFRYTVSAGKQAHQRRKEACPFVIQRGNEPPRCVSAGELRKFNPSGKTIRNCGWCVVLPASPPAIPPQHKTVHTVN